MYNRLSSTCFTPSHSPPFIILSWLSDIVLIRLRVRERFPHCWSSGALNVSLIISVVVSADALTCLGAVCQKPSWEPSVSCSLTWEPIGGRLSNLTLVGNGKTPQHTVTECLCFKLCAWVAVCMFTEYITGRALVFMLCHEDLSRHPQVSMCFSIK